MLKRAGKKKQVEAFAEEIDLNNSTLVLQYGAGCTKKRSQIFLTKRLENVRSKDLGETGTMLASLVSELKQTGEPEEEKGIFCQHLQEINWKVRGA